MNKIHRFCNTIKKKEISLQLGENPTSRRKEYGLERVYHRLTITIVTSFIKLSVLQDLAASGRHHQRENFGECVQ